MQNSTSTHCNLKPKILIIADVRGWIFERHALFLRENLKNQFFISIAYKEDYLSIKESDWDLIYPLEWNLIPGEFIYNPAKWITGIRSHVSWENYDFSLLCKYLNHYFSNIHTVSLRLYKIFENKINNIHLLTHGIDLEHFKTNSNISNKAGRINIGWAGNKLGVQKGFEELINPLHSLDGINLHYCSYSSKFIDYFSMIKFYENIDVYICTSISEGNNNSLLEAAAMNRAIITTNVGTVPEYLVHMESALIIDRDLASLKSALILLRDDPRLRIKLANNVRKAVNIFSWKKKLLDHVNFFNLSLNFSNS